MAFTAVSLVDLASGASSVLMPRDGVTLTQLDFQPSVRAVSEERVGGPGQVDYSLFLSVASLSLSLILWPSAAGVLPETIMDEIGAFLTPALRPVLLVSNDQWPQPRQISLRFDSKTAPVDNPTTVMVQISWKAPNGCWQATTVSEAIAPAFITALGGLAVSTAGMAVSTSGLAVTPATASGNPIVASGGNMPVPWSARLYGPCTGPLLANDTTGQVLSFDTGLVLAAGSYVQIDSQARSAFRNGDTSQSVLGHLQFDQSDWWMMQAGDNSIRYAPASASAGSQAVIDFQPAWVP